MKKTAMLWKVLIAIILAVFVGNLTGKDATIGGVTYFKIFDLLGQLFLNALTLLVVPLVSSSIINGLSGLGSEASFKRLGLKTFAFSSMENIL